MTHTAPLFGLVLSGGASRRMQTDKANLVYDGTPQLIRAFQLLQSLGLSTYVSVRKDQERDPLRATLPQIVDQQTDIGPLAGIAAAQARISEAAWLVLACDLPLLDKGTLQHLVGHRDVRAIATAYRSVVDGLPEPLCAIWEPASASIVRERIDQHQRCPRKLLMSNNATLLEQPMAMALTNVNTPEEYRQVGSDTTATTLDTHMEVQVEYFAVLREQAGKRQEVYATRANSPAILYAELQRRYGFQLELTQLRVAINHEFAEWSSVLHTRDHVAFIPPVAGG